MTNLFHHLLMLFAAFLISCAASIMLEVPKQFIIKNGLIGIVAEIVYLLSDIYFNETISIFIACLVVTFISHFSARLLRAPVTIFYIPVFFIFVPGKAIYEFAYYLIQSDKVRSGDALIEALNIAGAVALGVFISDSFLEIYLNCKNKYRIKKQKRNEQP